mmetsp:Transcript_15927/g.47942  ORF Transcript_15927/g.47942 Transcript_15927/m.47942 type:complete len:248 (-) Transcript_15927:815-1558(-)
MSRRRLWRGRQHHDFVCRSLCRACGREEGRSGADQRELDHCLPSCCLRRPRGAASCCTSPGRARCRRRLVCLLDHLLGYGDHAAQPPQLLGRLPHEDLAELRLGDLPPAALVGPEKPLSRLRNEFDHERAGCRCVGDAGELTGYGQLLQSPVEVGQRRQLVDDDLVDETPQPQQVLAAEGRHLVSSAALRVHDEVVDGKPNLGVKLGQATLVVGLDGLPLVLLELLDPAVEAVLPHPGRLLHQWDEQ